MEKALGPHRARALSHERIEAILMLEGDVAADDVEAVVSLGPPCVL